MLTDEQKRRYARHVVLSDIGEAGQEKLLSSSVLVIGAGGLGSACLAYLAAAGVGRIGIVEYDRVDLSNLQRQILFEEADIGRLKVEATADRLSELNPEIEIEIFPRRIKADNARDMIKDFDAVADGSDNFKTRFAVADGCMAERKPLISAAISGFEAQLSTFTPYLGDAHPCYRCFVPNAPERETTCEQEGIIGPLAGMMGSWQALEVIKELAGVGESLSGRVMVLNALAGEPKMTRLKRDEQCAHCAVKMAS